MSRVDNINRARFKKDDEFYTRYEDIEKELANYTQHFRGKVVYCNCDNPYKSNFCKFFLANFNCWGLKRLICTSYGDGSGGRDLFSMFSVARRGYILDVERVVMGGINKNDFPSLLKAKVRELDGDGDFRSEECIGYLKESDIVVTNPPFSLFGEYISLLVQYDKKFLIVGRETSVTHTKVFPLFKENKMWYGFSRIESFDRVDGSIVKFGNVVWFTNMKVLKDYKELILFEEYSEGKYCRYVNFDGIDIPSVSMIPKDYYGVMGVPSSFLFKYNPNQFEIIGYCNGVLGRSIGILKNRYNRHALALINKQGEYKIPFSRVLIKRK